MEIKSQKSIQANTTFPNNTEKILLSNSKEEYVSTPVDKLHLAYKECLEEHKYVAKIEKWGGILLAFLIPLFTSTFNDMGVISGEFIKGVFVAICCFSVIFIIYNFVLAIIHRDDYKFKSFVKRIADAEHKMNNDF